MRIISYGHITPKTMRCGGCGAVYEYLPKDVQTFQPGTKHVKNFVRCPICGHVTWVNVMLIKHDKYTVFKEDFYRDDIQFECNIKLKSKDGKKYDRRMSCVLDVSVSSTSMLERNADKGLISDKIESIVIDRMVMLQSEIVDEIDWTSVLQSISDRIAQSIFARSMDLRVESVKFLSEPVFRKLL